ncbi:MAG: hypothetical protein ACFB8W_08945 [Elainellaceae cyanobacterium]
MAQMRFFRNRWHKAPEDNGSGVIEGRSPRDIQQKGRDQIMDS